jgi:hypothetical protein
VNPAVAAVRMALDRVLWAVAYWAEGVVVGANCHSYTAAVAEAHSDHWGVESHWASGLAAQEAREACIRRSSYSTLSLPYREEVGEQRRSLSDFCPVREVQRQRCWRRHPRAVRKMLGRIGAAGHIGGPAGLDIGPCWVDCNLLWCYCSLGAESARHPALPHWLSRFCLLLLAGYCKSGGSLPISPEREGGDCWWSWLACCCCHYATDQLISLSKRAGESGKNGRGVWQ